MVFLIFEVKSTISLQLKDVRSARRLLVASPTKMAPFWTGHTRIELEYLAHGRHGPDPVNDVRFLAVISEQAESNFIRIRVIQICISRFSNFCKITQFSKKAFLSCGLDLNIFWIIFISLILSYFI